MLLCRSEGDKVVFVNRVTVSERDKVVFVNRVTVSERNKSCVCKPLVRGR